MSFIPRSVVLSLLASAALAACATPGIRESNANRLALPVFMIPRTITADDFQIKVYERAHAKNDTAIVYIEGSGDVMVDKNRFASNPTPTRPVGLQLASYDSHKNVIWLARPCQYGTTVAGAKECPVDYLTTRMFAPEVLAAYNAALDEIKARYQLTGFHLVGFGSGGGLATLLAAARPDVQTLRTAAGLLDTATYAKAHNLTGYEQSLNPINSVPQLVDMPQRHYIAQFDEVVPNAVYHSYAQAFGDDRCLGYTFIQNVDHNYDWAENWPAFAREDVTCSRDNPTEIERAARKRVYEPDITAKK